MNTKIKKTLITIATILGVLVIVTTTTYAIGTLEPQGTAGNDTHYSLNDIYNKLINFTATSTATSSPFAIPGTVEANFATLSDIYQKLQAENSDLVAGNIKNGVTIFGVQGSFAQQSYPVDQTLTDNGNGTVSDDSTKLMWAKCSLNEAGGITDTTACTDTTGSFTWATAQSNCNALSLAGSSWRLPTVSELTTIVDYNASSPTIYSPIATFPNTQSSTYWSVNAYGADNAWGVDFSYGAVSTYDNTASFNVRCVRNI